MKHICKRDFQRNFHLHTKDLSEPITVTKKGKEEMVVLSSISYNSMVSQDVNLNVRK